MCPQCLELRETVENWHLLAPVARKRILTAVVRPTLDAEGRIAPSRGREELNPHRENFGQDALQ